MGDDIALPPEFTDVTVNKVKSLIADEDNPDLKLRVYITGGGYNGFQYGFTFDDQMNKGDIATKKQGVGLVIDPMSLRYLVDGSVDYTEDLEGSCFTAIDPNAKSACGCGSSFSIQFAAHVSDRLSGIPPPFNDHSHPTQMSIT